MVTLAERRRLTIPEQVSGDISSRPCFLMNTNPIDILKYLQKLINKYVIPHQRGKRACYKGIVSHR